jgi:hypothetical protein
MHIHNHIIVELGFGNVGIIYTILKPTEVSPIGFKDVVGVVLEPMLESFEIGKVITSSDKAKVDESKPKIVIAFHNLESALILQECLGLAIQRLIEEDKIAAP